MVHLTRIYTRTGDAGSTRLGDMSEVAKTDLRVAAYGDVDAGLLSAFELEKACYEIRYEAGMRPDWLWLPMAAVERLAS